MKKLIIIIIISFSLFSCTEVVDIPLDNAAQKIVTEALINWERDTNGNVQKIKLKTTANYYSNIIPLVSGATVTITYSANTVFNFIETQVGEYVCNNFLPVLNQTYSLKVITNGKIYITTETLKPVALIISISQKPFDGTMNGKGHIIESLFLDPEATQDFYLFRYKTSYDIKTNVYVLADEFFNGLSFFNDTLVEKLKTNDVVKVTHFGISRTYFEYLEKLIGVLRSTGGLFSSPPITVRGNIINTTNVEDFPFGFFALSEIDVKSYTVQ